jgi:hypothetical protein
MAGISTTVALVGAWLLVIILFGKTARLEKRLDALERERDEGTEAQ